MAILASKVGQVKFIQRGEQGISGLSILREDWAIGRPYRNDMNSTEEVRYLYWVHISGTPANEWYVCKEAHNDILSEESNKPGTSGGEEFWTRADTSGPIYTPTLFANTISADWIESGTLSSSDVKSKTEEWWLKQDGSGYLAGGNISWNSSGDLLIKSGIISEKLEVGYRDSSDIWKVTSGINGIYLPTNFGGGVSYWAGGDSVDREVFPSGQIPDNAAKALIRMDGSGYLANGNISWSKEGVITADPMSFFVGEEIVGDILSLFSPVYENGSVIGIYAKYPMSVQGEVTAYSGVPLSMPSIFSGLPLDGDTVYWEDGFVKAKVGESGVSGWEELLMSEDKPTTVDEYGINDAVRTFELSNHSIDVTHVTHSERFNWNLAYEYKHTHHNSSALSGISQSQITNWNQAHAYSHQHGNISALGEITLVLIGNWNSAYTHSLDSVVHITAGERTSWNNKVDKVSGMGLSTNDFTNTLKTKLDGIEAGANKYVHPTTHPASIIVQDSSNRFVTDTEKSNWNTAYTNNHTHTNKSVIDGITSSLVSNWNTAYTNNHIHTNKSVIDGITSSLVSNWNTAYTHISDTVKHITADERTSWNNKLDKSIWDSAFYFKDGNLYAKLNLVGEKEIAAYGSGDLDEGGGGIITIIDHLNSTSSDAALSARQGSVLKGLIDNKVSVITKTMVEDVLQGNITTHTHSYLPLTGGTLSGGITFNATTIGETTPMISWMGGNDNARLFYEYLASDAGKLVFLIADNQSDPIEYRWSISGGASHQLRHWMNYNGIYTNGAINAVGTISQNGTAVSLNGHTHNYAGSSSAGGVATNSLRLSNTSAIGSTTKGVYFSAAGVPVEMTYSLNKDVPSNAVFTDTVYTHPTQTAISVTNANGRVLSGITVNTLGHTTGCTYKTLAEADIPALSISKISNLQSTLDSKFSSSNLNIGTDALNYAAGNHNHSSISGGSAYLTAPLYPLQSGQTFYYFSGQPTIGTATGNSIEGSSSNANLWSYPKGGTVASSVANIQNLRLFWSSSYLHDIFASPNQRWLWHRWISNGSAKAWTKIVMEDSDEESSTWGISISKNAATATKLQNSRTLWGQNFDGLGNISGDLREVRDIIGAGSITIQSTGDTSSIKLSRGNDDGAVYLNNLAFQPLPAANGLLNLGVSNARWKGIYGNTLDLSAGLSATTGSFSGNTTIGGTSRLNGVVTVSESTTTGHHVAMKFYNSNSDNTGANGRFIMFESSSTDNGYGCLIGGIREADGGKNAFIIKTGTNSPIERFRITDSGNVGIGTASPSYKLDVNGTTRVNTLTISNTSATPHLIFSRVGWNYVVAPSGGQISFNVDGASNAATNSLLLTSDKNVGIGVGNVTSLTEKLYVNGTFRATGNSIIGGTLAVGGTLKIGEATFTWDSSNKCLRLDTSLVSEGELCAYGAGTVEGGGSGSIVIVDNLTSTSTDSALSARQGNVLKGLIDSKVSVITKTMVEDVLQGNITTHTHSYLPLTGGTLTGSVSTSGSITADNVWPIRSVTKTLAVTVDWMDTGIVLNTSNFPDGNGSYMISVYTDSGATTGIYKEMFTGVCTIYTGTTNSADTDEIVLHSNGHARNSKWLYLQTQRVTGNGYTKLQIASSTNLSSASFIFKFKRIM